MRRLSVAAAVVVLALTGCNSGSDGSAVGASSVVSSAPAAPTSLDKPTSDWFSHLCEAMTVLNVKTNGTPAAVAAAVTAAGDTLITTSSQLGAMPAPTFTGGQEFAATVVSELAGVGTLFHQAGTELADGDLEPARQTMAKAAAVRPLDLSDLDPAISPLVQKLPACQSVTSAF